MKIRNTKLQRKTRISRKIKGTEEKPRLSVFRSNNAIYAQLINDKKGQTILGVTEKHLPETLAKGQSSFGRKIEKAKALGIVLAQKAKEKKISEVVFDKGSYKYHGRIKALAEGAREEGLQF